MFSYQMRWLIYESMVCERLQKKPRLLASCRSFVHFRGDAIACMRCICRQHDLFLPTMGRLRIITEFIAADGCLKVALLVSGSN